MPQMAEKTEPDAAPNCAVVPKKMQAKQAQRSFAHEGVRGNFIASILSSGSTLFHLVPQPPDHLQVTGMGGVNLDLLPQVPDVDGYRVLTA